MATPGKDTAEPGTNGVQSVTSCWGETNHASCPWAELVSRRLILAALRSGAVRNARTALTSEGSTGIGRLSAPTMEYTGEPLWLTGTVSKIC